MKWFYEVMYRHFTAPWEIGPRQELVELVEKGNLTPCRAIDLGCGTGANAIFLAQQGFDTTGVDSPWNRQGQARGGGGRRVGGVHDSSPPHWHPQTGSLTTMKDTRDGLHEGRARTARCSKSPNTRDYGVRESSRK